jgi:hypothetical protein
MHLVVCLLAFAQPQDVPADFRRAETAARDFLGELGVPTRGVRVAWGPIDPREYGETEESLRRFPNRREEAMQLGRTIWMDHTVGPRPLLQQYLFHEFWHYYQQQRGGGSNWFDWAYKRLGCATRPLYLKNRFEREAYFMQVPLYREFRWRERNPRGAWEAHLRSTLADTLPRLRRIWSGSPIAPKHLDRLETELLGAHDRATTARREVAGALTYAAAFLVKEAVDGRFPEAATELRDPAFWGSLAVFTIAARATERAIAAAPLPALAKSALPLAAGMAAVQLLSGHVSARDVALSTGAYLAAGLVVNAIADGLIYPLLFAAGPPGWAAAGVYTVGKLAATLWLGDRLAAWLHRRLPPRAGLVGTIDALRP